MKHLVTIILGIFSCSALAKNLDCQMYSNFGSVQTDDSSFNVNLDAFDGRESSSLAKNGFTILLEQEADPIFKLQVAIEQSLISKTKILLPKSQVPLDKPISFWDPVSNFGFYINCSTK
jgi:hypothetical protein